MCVVMGGHRGFSLWWSRWQRGRACWRGGSRGTGWTSSSSSSSRPCRPRYPAAYRPVPGPARTTTNVSRTRGTWFSTWRSPRRARQIAPDATIGERLLKNVSSREKCVEIFFRDLFCTLERKLIVCELNFSLKLSLFDSIVDLVALVYSRQASKFFNRKVVESTKL